MKCNKTTILKDKINCDRHCIANFHHSVHCDTHCIANYRYSVHCDTHWIANYHSVHCDTQCIATYHHLVHCDTQWIANYHHSVHCDRHCIANYHHSVHLHVYSFYHNNKPWNKLQWYTDGSDKQKSHTVQDPGLVSCDAASLDELLLTFQWITAPLSLRVKMKALQSFATRELLVQWQSVTSQVTSVLCLVLPWCQDFQFSQLQSPFNSLSKVWLYYCGTTIQLLHTATTQAQLAGSATTEDSSHAHSKLYNKAPSWCPLMNYDVHHSYNHHHYHCILWKT